MTALGNPKLLERMSACIVELRRLFQKFDTQVRVGAKATRRASHHVHPVTALSITSQGRGHITRAQFIEGYNKYFVSANDGSSSKEAVDPKLARLLERLDPKGSDRIDYIEWSNTLRLKDVPELTRWVGVCLVWCCFW